MNTKQPNAKKVFAPGSSRGRRTSPTFLLHMARDLQRQQAMGARLKELRESRRDLTQQKIAEHVGITVRGYQFWEAGDTGIDHDNVVRLADLFGVTTDYLYDGEPAAEPEVDRGQLDRIEAELTVVRRLLEALLPDETLGDLLDDLEQAPARPAQRRAAGGA